MAQIKIYGDVQKGCIFFDGSTVEPKFLGTILAEIKADETDRIVIYRTDRTDSEGNDRKLFRRLNPNRVQNEAGEDLISALGYTVAQVVEYINEQANLTASVNPDVNTDLSNISVDFTRDATSTSIIFSNGYQFGVNTIKAMDTGDGLITIKSIEGSRELFTKLDVANVQVNGSAVSGGLNDVINTLNEFFTVGAFESVVISDPYSTMIADVNGEAAGYTLEGVDAIDPIGDDIFTFNGTGYREYAGLKSTATINQAGEYYTFDIRGEGAIGFGLVHTQTSYDAGLFLGNTNYANPTSFATLASAHYGFQFSHWFHPTPNGSWTNYGANTSYSQRPGWSNFNGTDEQADWLAGNPIKIRVGIDENGYIYISTLRNGTDWVVHSRSGYPVLQGSSFHLGVKSHTPAARVFSAPKVHLLEEAAPTMYFRYIESPDGNFEYPLFATAEEANYYDEQNGGSGASHTHTYADDATGTTWYMPATNSTMTATSAPAADLTLGQAAAYTEITSLTNADLTPAAFSGNDITQEEGTNVNIQVSPQDVGYSTSVDISPSGSGLVFDGSYLIQGTLSDVGSDTTYTVTVTRANSYGSSVGTFTITATDVAPPQTNLTPWTKALDFSGGSEYALQVSPSSSANAIRMQGLGSLVVANPNDSNKTSGSSYARPWATAIVFRPDGNSSNQHIWNSGEGAGSNDDNIYLRLDSVGNLYFGWGRSGSLNECVIGAGFNSSSATSQFWGVYIAHKGTRYSASNATAANLADAFDIRIMYYAGGNWVFAGVNGNFADSVGNRSTETNWGRSGSSTGGRMDRSFTGTFTIGGRGSNRNFHGKVASMVVTHLRLNVDMPTDAEIKLMITDPKTWEDDYRVGQQVRHSYGVTNATYNPSNLYTGYGNTQIWLMGDGTSDSYANGIRNDVYPNDQNYTKLQLNSMVSNDIETVNINGLT